MAMYLFASRISAAVCARTPPSPTIAAPSTHSSWPDRSPTHGVRQVCLLQPRKSKTHKKVVLAVTAEDLEGKSRDDCSDNHGCPPPYHESEPSPPPLIYEDDHLVSGTLEALTGLLVPTTTSYPDRGFLFAFLLTSRLFILPHELLTQVLAACHAQQTSLDKPSTAKERLERIMPPMVRLLEDWTDMFPYDFRDEAMTAAVRGITQGCDCVPWVCDDVSRLLQTLLARLTTLDKFEHQLAALDGGRPVHDRARIPATDTAEVCGSPVVLAQQLTAVELERMAYIGPEEFVLGYMREVSHPLHHTNTGNLDAYVAWTSRLSHLVATEICKQSVKKQRVKTTEFWVEAAKECFNIGNFNSLAAILGGLNMAPVSRLSKTWSKTSSERLTVLRQAMDSSSDHDNYRATLKTMSCLQWSKTSSERLTVLRQAMDSSSDHDNYRATLRAMSCLQWSKTSSERLTVLRQAMDSSSDHDNYRATLKAMSCLQWSKTSSERLTVLRQAMDSTSDHDNYRATFKAMSCLQWSKTSSERLTVLRQAMDSSSDHDNYRATLRAMSCLQWSKTSSERLTVLRQAMDSSSDHDNYRATLKAAVWRAAGGSGSGQNIVVPLFSLLVKDLHSLTEMCSNKLPNGHINMEAAWSLAKSLADFISWQQTTCPFPRCSKAVAYLQGSPVLSENALMMASFDCETPETTMEKEHYITLKFTSAGH